MDPIIIIMLLFFLLATMVVGGAIIAALLSVIFKPSRTPAPVAPEPSDDLAATERQLIRFYQDGKISDEIYELLMARIRAERAGAVPFVAKPQPAPQAAPKDSTKVVDEIVIEPAPAKVTAEPRPPRAEFKPPTPPPSPPPRPRRRPFNQVLNSFMEESNIRWGEIIGGLLIIGCSTALVVSLWAQISAIPVLKFLIFTTVTAVLFGIGLYTEHRWKLPTTSRGILTIATLLVPLNFLAIAAVSASTTPGLLVLGSELAAPVIFLCLVYFAGRVITPGCAHILAAGVLASSIGQLLVRHFAAPDASPALLILLAAFPIACYIVTVSLTLRFVLSERRLDENEVTTVFTILGTMSFAALLPFSLLLYKSGPLSLTMMYLAPIVTLWGLPLLATGTVFWRRINNKKLVASRTAGTALGILGLVIVLAGMVLAWPNPASIVPAALFNFAIFTALALALNVPVAHLIAAHCFALAYLVFYHVLAGHIPWRNLRVMSLLEVTLTVSSGRALAGAFVIFLLASEWLSKQKRARDSYYYLIAAWLMAVASLILFVFWGFWFTPYQWLWIVFGSYSLGAFWIAWRKNSADLAWLGSVLLVFALAEGFGRTLSFSFPWQTALLAQATICAAGAIAASRHFKTKILSKPLSDSAMISVALAVVTLFQANRWEVTAMQAQRVFWIAGILLLLLWLHRRRVLFNAFQIALICAVVLAVKAALQQFEWYAYLPHAFLHPSALQIYGTVLVLLCLAWLALRFIVKRAQAKQDWLRDAWRLLDSDYSVDRFLSWLLLGAFVLFAVYGSLAGLTQELAGWGNTHPAFNIAGFPHQEALALGSWIVLGLLTVLMLADFWERRRSEYLLGALAVLSGAMPLLAGRFESQLATATAWRWLAALFLWCGSLVLWYRIPLWRRLEEFGWPPLDEARRQELSRKTRTLLIVLTVVPLLLLTLFLAMRAIWYLPVNGPLAGIFASLSDDVSYGGPLLLVALVMVGYALRERIPEYGFFGGLLINATVTLAFLLAVVAARGYMDRVVLIRLAQLNAITFAVYSLPWLSARGLWRSKLSEARTRLADTLFDLNISLAISLNVALILPVAAGLVIQPEPPGMGTIAAGSSLGWLALATTLVAVIWLVRIRGAKLSPVLLAGALLGISCLTAFSVADIGGTFALCILAVCTTFSAWLILIAASLQAQQILSGKFALAHDWKLHCQRLAAFAGGIAAYLAFVVNERWWSIAPLLALSVLFAVLNWQTLHRRYIYAAGVLFTLAFLIWSNTFFLSRSFFISRFFVSNLIAGCLAGIVWLWLELRARRLQEGEITRRAVWSFHNLIAIGWFSLFALVVLASFGLAGPQTPLLQTPVLYWLGFAALVALMAACLWDKHAKYAVVGLYLLGLIAGAMALHQLQLTASRLTWSTTIFLASYALVVAFIWRQRQRLIVYARQLGVPSRISPDATQLQWLSFVTILSGIFVITLAYWIDLHFLSFGLRSTAALVVIAQFVTFGLFAEGPWKYRWQRVALAILFIGVVFLGWSGLTPGSTGTWLNRSVILMLLAFGLTALYGLLLKQSRIYSPEWTSATQSIVPLVAGAGVVALCFCLGTEVFYQLNFGAVRIHPVSLVAIGVTLIAAIVISVLFALSPQRDPLNLSERGRMKYVYAAEIMLALLFLHIRLTLPWLFTGLIERYWPLVVMLIAYLGVVAGEALRRRKLLVLAQPLERTGVFLPLLPVLGFWLASSEVDFSVVLFVVGGLYGLLSILRRSFVFGLMAAVVGNAALWYVLHRTDDYQFLQHPQLWLIPVALSALLAGYLNEDNLTRDHMTGIRYLSLVTIYVSSTADIFINGVANSPWLPLILGSFSVAGVFAGIIFRIRGLLLLGSVFLLLSIITMIWYASVNLGWTWLWYVAGIVTGATIIFMFAVFEKKRSEVLRLVEELKEWQR